MARRVDSGHGLDEHRHERVSDDGSGGAWNVNIAYYGTTTPGDLNDVNATWNINIYSGPEHQRAERLRELHALDSGGRHPYGLAALDPRGRIEIGHAAGGFEVYRAASRPSAARAALAGDPRGAAVVGHRQPIASADVELIRGSASDSALDTLLQRGLVGHNQHHLLVTTRELLDLAGLRHLADLPPLPATQ